MGFAHHPYDSIHLDGATANVATNSSRKTMDRTSAACALVTSSDSPSTALLYLFYKTQGHYLSLPYHIHRCDVVTFGLLGSIK